MVVRSSITRVPTLAPTSRLKTPKLKELQREEGQLALGVSTRTRGQENIFSQLEVRGSSEPCVGEGDGQELVCVRRSQELGRRWQVTLFIKLFS